MGASTDAVAFLSSWVQRDKKLITYRLLSRELRIHVEDAKSALSTFYDSHSEKTELDATYILIGRSKHAAVAKDADDKDAQPEASSSTAASSSSNPPRNYLDQRIARRQTADGGSSQLIRLVSADNLDEAKASFDELTSCHVYSVSPGRLRDATQLTAIQHELHSQQKYTDVWQQTNRGADLGVVINPSIKDNYDPSKAIPSLGAPSAPALQVKTEAKSSTAAVVKSETPAQDAKPSAAAAKAAPSAAASGGKKSGLDWSRAKPKDAESKPAAVKKEAAASTGTASKSKRASARKALLGSDDEDEEDEDGASRRRAIAIDDEDDEDDDKPEKLGYADDQADDEDEDVEMAAPRGSGKQADARTQTKSQAAAQRKQLEAMMDTDDDEVQVVEPSGSNSRNASTGQAKDADPNVEMASTTVTETMNGSDAPAAAKRRVRKKRRIGTKKVRSKDERGYTVTKTVDEYESYSSEESDAPVVTGSKRAAATSAKQKSAAESKSTSTSASASPAPSAPAPTSAKSTPANSAAAKKASGATPAPAKKGQQSLNSFFTRKPKDK